MDNKLTWVKSYETVKFDTNDGDLDKGQYARFKNGYLVRIHPKNNHQCEFVETLDTTGMIEVQILSGQHMYYDVFKLPNGRMYRIPSNSKKYWDTARIRNHPQPEKSVTDVQISNIIKDDNKWR